MIFGWYIILAEKYIQQMTGKPIEGMKLFWRKPSLVVQLKIRQLLVRIKGGPNGEEKPSPYGLISDNSNKTWKTQAKQKVYWAMFQHFRW